jgi:hypothetical protein
MKQQAPAGGIHRDPRPLITRSGVAIMVGADPLASGARRALWLRA